MNFFKTLPLGLALTASMMLSSCSQEHGQVTGPETITPASNMKIAALPTIPTTNGPTGNNKFASGWEKITFSNPDNLQEYAAGTSNKDGLWGSAFLPWVKPLPSPDQSGANNGNFLTFIRQKKFLNPSSSTFSTVATTIENLIPGKKYAFTFKVASTILVKNGELTQYAPTIDVSIPGTISAPTSHTYINLVGKEAEWVQKTITFIAQTPEVSVWVTSSCDAKYYDSYSKFFNYSHIYVPQNAVVEVP